MTALILILIFDASKNWIFNIGNDNARPGRLVLLYFSYVVCTSRGEIMSLSTDASILACTLRGYSHEDLAKKLALMAVYMERIARDTSSAEEAMDRADAALRNTGVSECLK